MNKMRSQLLLMVKLLLFVRVLGNHAGSIFISEPVNITVVEGDSVTFNCSSTMNEFFAIWIIGGLQYLWSEFENSETYTFNQLNNSLTINSSPRSLNGLSFQCVIDRHESQIGYLTVLYTDGNSMSTTLVSSELPTKIVTATSLSDSTIFTESSTIIIPESTSGIYIDHLTVILSISCIGVVLSITIILSCVSIICLVRRYKLKREYNSAMTENFEMKRNEVYGRVSHIHIKMKRNSAYSDHHSHFSRSP